MFNITIYASGILAALTLVLVSLHANAKLSVCDCVNTQLTNDEIVSACNDMMNAMNPQELAKKSVACRSGEKLEVNFCNCLRSNSTDPGFVRGCEKLLESVEPAEAAQKFEQCRGP